MSASFAPECTDVKKAYDNCFNEWYSEKFLRGKSITNECEETWAAYESCVKKALVDKGLVKVLDEARAEAPFEDGGKFKDDDKKES
ncbi:MDM35-like protein [Dipodascopsis tothii]|uniref:MDM35-like protein n=1 Tax=Dipodascopsis tothii TaxID=44089 RepID=UPI0034CE07DF